MLTIERRSPRPSHGRRAVRAAAVSELRGLKEKYLTWLVATGYAETTVRNSHADLEWLLRFLELRAVSRVADMTTEVLRDFSLWLREQNNRYHENRSVSLAHVLHRLTTLKAFCRWLVKELVVLQDPAEDLEIPRLAERLPLSILTQEEARRLLDAPELRSPVGYRDKALLELLYSTGIRTAELLRLRVSDLDFKAGTVFVRRGKGNKDRLLVAPIGALGYAREYIVKVRPRFAKNMKKGDDGTLFINWTGAKLDINRLAELLRRNAKLAKLDKRVTAMTLRHSIASHLLENGMDLRFIQEFLGHTKMSTTQIYARVTLSGLRKTYNKTHPRERRSS